MNPADLARCLRARSSAMKAMIIADDNVMVHAEAIARSLHEAGFQPTIASVSPGEPSKSLAVAAQLYDALGFDAGRPQDAGRRRGRRRRSATWPASSPRRSTAACRCSWCRRRCWRWSISSVGGKVGVNHPRARTSSARSTSRLGVWIDTAMLATLPDREYRSGLAEVVKYGVILDAEFFAWLEDERRRRPARDAGVGRATSSTRCCELKADVVEQDEREETGLRAVLNYGHTFAHAFETVGGYGAWLHGEAVAAGMVCASRLAERLGLIGPM